jgi:hypothetical protein
MALTIMLFDSRLVGLRPTATGQSRLKTGIPGSFSSQLGHGRIVILKIWLVPGDRCCNLDFDRLCPVTVGVLYLCP